MKIRNSFVSNSSSCSFTVRTANLTEKQQRQLLAYTQQDSYTDRWDIYYDSNGKLIHGFTAMDNEDLWEYCKQYNIPIEDFRIERD